MQICKVCEKPYKSINASHLKTHGMTKEDYEKYTEVTIEVKETKVSKASEAWSKIDLKDFNTRMKFNYLEKTKISLARNNFIDRERTKICGFCKDEITEMRVFIILNTPMELRTKRPLSWKKPYHEGCAYATATMSDKVAYALVVKRVTKVTNDTDDE